MAGKQSGPNVLIAAAECAPLAKAGGLADVVGALPKYLAPLGVDARVIMPFHSAIKAKYRSQVEHLGFFYVDLGWRHQYAGIEKMVLDGTTFYFVDNEFYFGGPIYCGGEFECEQYAFFTRAVLDSIPMLDFEPQVLHCNDWHTAIMPMLLKTQYANAPQGKLKSLLTIHNMAYQGSYWFGLLADLLGLAPEDAGIDRCGHNGSANMLKAGILFADRVNTVSPTYAGEITTPAFGETLEAVLSSRGSLLTGVLNGIDTDVWNPATDRHLPETCRFSRDYLDGKTNMKAALCRELDLAYDPDRPLMAMVGRLTPQKGVDLVEAVIEPIMERGVTLAILGTGYPAYEESLSDAARRHQGRLCARIGFDGPLSHRMYAGSDLFLMPSAFEPCGISQLIAMRYGSLPIVRETGGLKDTVAPFNKFTGEGTGFSFGPYDAWEMLGAIDRALEAWHQPDVRASLISQAMSKDFGFGTCAAEYAKLYRSL